MARTKRDPPAEAKALEPLPPFTQVITRQGEEAVAYHIPVSRPSTENLVPKTTIALPPRSTWTSGLHFHTTHDEHLRLIQGAIFVELDGELKILSAKAGGQVSLLGKREVVTPPSLTLHVKRYARHNWGRAKEYLIAQRLLLHRKVELPDDIDEEVIVEEYTDPADISKPLFFWNLNGVITASRNAPLPRGQSLAKSVLGDYWIPIQLFVIFWELDNWPVFFDLWGTLGIAGPTPLGVPGRAVQRTVEYIVTGTILFWASLAGKTFGVRAVNKERTPHELWIAYGKGGASFSLPSTYVKEMHDG